MLEKLKSLWSDSTDSDAKREHELSLAVTAVMVEVMRIDDKNEDAEHDAVVAAVEKRFGLSLSEVHALVEKAKKETSEASDLHQFTSQIIKAYDTEERIEIIKELWQVAMADGHIDVHEEHLIRRTAELIGVYHKEFIGAKIAARSVENEA